MTTTPPSGHKVFTTPTSSPTSPVLSYPDSSAKLEQLVASTPKPPNRLKTIAILILFALMIFTFSLAVGYFIRPGGQKSTSPQDDQPTLGQLAPAETPTPKPSSTPKPAATPQSLQPSSASPSAKTASPSATPFNNPEP